MSILILQLEDSALDADLACAKLRKAGVDFLCDRVETEPEFVSMLQSKPYDLVLADYALPGFSGLQAMQLARRLTPHLPFIIVSGVVGEEFAIDMLQRGATDYVLKSKLDRLGPAVQRALMEAREKTERRRVENQLKDSEERYRVLVEALPQLIWTCTPDGQCDFLNTKWVEYSGIPESEQLGFNWLKVVHPDDREQVRSCWMRSVEEHSRYDIEFRIRSSDGPYRWFKSRAIPLTGDDGRVVKWFGSSTDIQEQKEAEEELRRQTEALARSNSDLQQFAYVASHDLQEPLRSVISYTQLLQKRYRDRLDADADEFIRYAVEGATRMQKLIQDVLDYSRATMDRERTRELIPLEKPLQGALGNLGALINESKALITYDALPKVWANQVQFTQVFQNLLSNALKYRRPEAAPRITISTARIDPGWVITVRDNGVGFDPRQSERIFGIFQRLHGRGVPGTGMGLAICKRIVEAHGGHIWAQAQLGHGATFHFTVPAEPSAA